MMTPSKVRFDPILVTAYIRAPTSSEETALKLFQEHALECSTCRGFVDDRHTSWSCLLGARRVDALSELIRWNGGKFVATSSRANVYDTVVEIPRRLVLSRKILYIAACSPHRYLNRARESGKLPTTFFRKEKAPQEADPNIRTMTETLRDGLHFDSRNRDCNSHHIRSRRSRREGEFQRYEYTFNHVIAAQGQRVEIRGYVRRLYNCT